MHGKASPDLYHTQPDKVYRVCIHVDQALTSLDMENISAMFNGQAAGQLISIFDTDEYILIQLEVID